MKIDTIRYVFENKQPELRRLVVKYGLTPAKNQSDLWKKVNYLVAKFKDEMLRDIALIHPDKALILWAEAPQGTENAPTPISESDVNPDKKPENKENKSGACGCSGADGVDYSYCSGNPNCNCDKGKAETKSNADGKSFADTMKDNMPLVIVGSLLLVGGLILFGNRQVR